MIILFKVILNLKLKNDVCKMECAIISQIIGCSCEKEQCIKDSNCCMLVNKECLNYFKAEVNGSCCNSKYLEYENCGCDKNCEKIGNCCLDYNKCKRQPLPVKKMNVLGLQIATKYIGKINGNILPSIIG
jgi:hypothetical protein